MASPNQPDDKSPPATLAGLWLKGRPARTLEPESYPSKAAPAPALPQMDLLFAEPPEAHTAARPAPRARRKAAASPTAPTPASTRPRLPAQSRATPAPAPSDERRIWSIHELVAGVRRKLEQQYQDIWLQGEISNCRPAPSGHIYFTLKDGEAQLQVVLFRGQAQLLPFRPEDGLAILARGRISVYEPRGQLQLIAETLLPRGVGLLQIAFEQLKARLLGEGLFDAARKRPLPAFPRTIGIVTSTGGAVLHDIIQVTRRRHSRLNLLVYPAAVQGSDCARSVTAGIDWFNAHPDKVDLILIARGGGSLEDLAGFNDETLARAIAASQLPIVSAVGHETDFTIADLVADLRAPTPSAAAEIITAAQHRIEERVQSLDSRVRRAIRYQLMLARQRFAALSLPQIQSQLQTLIGRRAQHLDDLRHRLESSTARRLRAPSARLAALTTRIERQNPTLRLALAAQRLEQAGHSLARLATASVTTRQTRLNQATARLHALSPLAVLNRGYALVYAANGTLLRSAADVQPHQQIRARLAHGTLEAEVTKTEPPAA